METRENLHIDDGTLLALLDDEIEAAERRRVEAHVASCERCADLHTELRFMARRATAALEVADEPAPWTEMPEVLRQAAAARPRSLADARSGRPRLGGRAAAMAAGLTLVLAAGAYAVPGSPVRGWVDEGVEAIAALLGFEAPAAEEVRASEVSVQPVDGTVRVDVRGAAEGLRVMIGLTDETGAAASARAGFRVESGLIEVSDPSGELRVTLPRGVASASVSIDGVEVARLEAGRLIRTEGADTGPAEILLQN